MLQAETKKASMDNVDWVIALDREVVTCRLRITGRYIYRRLSYDIMKWQGATWTRTAKDRKKWKELTEGYFQQWRDTA